LTDSDWRRGIAEIDDLLLALHDAVAANKVYRNSERSSLRQDASGDLQVDRLLDLSMRLNRSLFLLFRGRLGGPFPQRSSSAMTSTEERISRV